MKTSQQPLTISRPANSFAAYAMSHEAFGARRARPTNGPQQEEWARVFGRSQPTIARWMGLARLEAAVREALDEGRMDTRRRN